MESLWIYIDVTEQILVYVENSEKVSGNFIQYF